MQRLQVAARTATFPSKVAQAFLISIMRSAQTFLHRMHYSVGRNFNMIWLSAAASSFDVRQLSWSGD
jgi:hypothetical protein